MDTPPTFLNTTFVYNSYWAVRKLGYSATELSRKLGVSQPSVSISVKRGEKIAKVRQLKLIKE